MKTIFVATDFSKASRNAAVFGVQLAKAFEAKLILFHAYQIPLTSPDWPVMVNKEDIILLIEHQLRDEVAAINKPGIVVETIHEEGPVQDLIIVKANSLNADILVAGMKAKGKGIRKLFGSTITGLKKETKVPLIVIPEDATAELPETIALASEIDLDSNLQFLQVLQKISKKLSSKLCIVRVNKAAQKDSEEMETYPRSLSTVILNVKHEFKERKDRHVNRALQNFIKENNVGMLAMISHKHPIVERLFLKSNIKEMIFNCSIPLLILPDIHNEYQNAMEQNTIQLRPMKEEEEYLIY